MWSYEESTCASVTYKIFSSREWGFNYYLLSYTGIQKISQYVHCNRKIYKKLRCPILFLQKVEQNLMSLIKSGKFT